MNTTTKTIIFLVIAFVVVIGITFATRTASAPTKTTATSTPQITASSTPAAKTYTYAQVAEHKTPTDCWTVVNGSVYNLTPFVNQHPGGMPNIIKLCGIEGTAIFMAQHGGQGQPEAQLATLKIGVLAK
jgi:cytochrome b involved in lipid metabolism